MIGDQISFLILVAVMLVCCCINREDAPKIMILLVIYVAFHMYSPTGIFYGKF